MVVVRSRFRIFARWEETPGYDSFLRKKARNRVGADRERLGGREVLSRGAVELEPCDGDGLDSRRSARTAGPTPLEVESPPGNVNGCGGLKRLDS